MALVHVIVGSLIIICGFIVKQFPNLISSYNTLQGEKKKDIDIDGLTTYIRNGMIIIGALIIAGYFLIQKTNFTHFTPFIIMFFLLGGALVLKTGAQKFDRNNPKFKK